MRCILLLVLATSAFAELPTPRFREATIDDKVEPDSAIAVADVDGDQLPDILLADRSKVVWYRNPGAPSQERSEQWAKYTIAENLHLKGRVCIAARDLDGSFKCQVLIGGSGQNPGFEPQAGAFYLSPPQDRTMLWEVVPLSSITINPVQMEWASLGKDDNYLLVASAPEENQHSTLGRTAHFRCYLKAR